MSLCFWLGLSDIGDACHIGELAAELLELSENFSVEAAELFFVVAELFFAVHAGE